VTEELPDYYRELLESSGQQSETTGPRSTENDPWLTLAGSGRSLWASEHADEYVKRLREGW